MGLADGGLLQQIRKYVSVAERTDPISLMLTSGGSYVSPVDHGTQNSQPMIRADGTVVDTFYDHMGGADIDTVTQTMYVA